MAEHMSGRGYAAHRRARGLTGGTHEAVRKAIATGRIIADADGRIDPDRADAAWAAFTRFRIDHLPRLQSHAAERFDESRELNAMIAAVVPVLSAATDADEITEIVNELVLDVFAAARRRGEMLPDPSELFELLEPREE